MDYDLLLKDISIEPYIDNIPPGPDSFDSLVEKWAGCEGSKGSEPNDKDTTNNKHVGSEGSKGSEIEDGNGNAGSIRNKKGELYPMKRYYYGKVAPLIRVVAK